MGNYPKYQSIQTKLGLIGLKFNYKIDFLQSSHFKIFQNAVKLVLRITLESNNEKT